MAFAYALALAARDKTAISVLDWGGGAGQYGYLARRLVPDVNVDFHCRDLPSATRAGRLLLPDATFHDSDESAFARRYDFVCASSALHYVNDWRSVLSRLAVATGSYLLVTRQPILQKASSFVVLQRPHRHAYPAEYPGWFLNREEFLAEASKCGMALIREFLVWEQPQVRGAPEQAEYRGFLFVPTERGGDE